MFYCFWSDAVKAGQSHAHINKRVVEVYQTLDGHYQQTGATPKQYLADKARKVLTLYPYSMIASHTDSFKKKRP